MFGQSGLKFGTVFRQFGLKFQDCSRTCRTKFSKMFSGVLDSMESPSSQKFAKTDSFFFWHLMCRDILINFTSYYQCSYRMRLARKVLLESKFGRYSRFESPVYVLWLKS